MKAPFQNSFGAVMCLDDLKQHFSMMSLHRDFDAGFWLDIGNARQDIFLLLYAPRLRIPMRVFPMTALDSASKQGITSKASLTLPLHPSVHAMSHQSLDRGYSKLGSTR